MKKFLHRFDLTNWYEKYSRLVTQEGKKQFTRIVYTLSVCAVTIVFIWYCGTLILSSQQNVKSAQDQPTPSASSEQAQSSRKPSVISDPQVQAPATNSPSDSTQRQNEGVNNNTPGGSAVNVPQQTPAKPAETKKNYGPVKKSIYRGANLPQIALTFDDGYDKKSIEMILNTLKKKNIKCTFFVIGDAIAKNPGLWKRAINEGHQICNHTAHHRNLLNLPDNAVQDEITGWEAAVKKYIGEDYLKRMKREFPFMRFPGGNGGNSDRILSIAQKNGYTVIAWNVETFTSVIRPLNGKLSVAGISKKIEEHVIKKGSNGSIVLFHFNQYDRGNLDGVIDGLEKRGFSLKQLTDMIK